MPFVLIISGTFDIEQTIRTVWVAKEKPEEKYKK
jgi:hypothetical protein